MTTTQDLPESMSRKRLGVLPSLPQRKQELRAFICVHLHNSECQNFLLIQRHRRNNFRNQKLPTGNILSGSWDTTRLLKSSYSLLTECRHLINDLSNRDRYFLSPFLWMYDCGHVSDAAVLGPLVIHTRFHFAQRWWYQTVFGFDRQQKCYFPLLTSYGSHQCLSCQFLHYCCITLPKPKYLPKIWVPHKFHTISDKNNGLLQSKPQVSGHWINMRQPCFLSREDDQGECSEVKGFPVWIWWQEAHSTQISLGSHSLLSQLDYRENFDPYQVMAYATKKTFPDSYFLQPCTLSYSRL